MAQINSDSVDIPSVNFEEQSGTPTTPAAGRRKIFAKSDGFYELNSSGSAKQIASGQNLADIAALTPSDSLMIVGDGNNFVGETGATLRTSIGVGAGDSPTFTGLTLSGLTASRLLASGASSELASVSDLTAWIAGTANQITVTDDLDGTVTLSLPQDIHTGASPTFSGLTLSGLTASKVVVTDGSSALTTLADTSGMHARVVGWWYQDNVAASQTTVQLMLGGDAVRTELPMARAGSVVGIAIYSNEARTAGTLTVDATIDGVATGLTAVLDATNPQTHYATQAIALDTFTAGQRIGVEITTDASWAPTTADITVIVEVAFD